MNSHCSSPPEGECPDETKSESCEDTLEPEQFDEDESPDLTTRYLIVILNDIPQVYPYAKLQTLEYFQVKFSERWNPEEDMNEYKSDSLSLSLSPCDMGSIHPRVTHATLQSLLSMTYEKNCFQIPVTMAFEELLPTLLLSDFLGVLPKALMVAQYLENSRHLITTSDLQLLKNSCTQYKKVAQLVEAVISLFTTRVVNLSKEQGEEIASCSLRSHMLLRHDPTPRVRVLQSQVGKTSIFILEKKFEELSVDNWNTQSEEVKNMWKEFRRNPVFWDCNLSSKILSNLRKLWNGVDSAAAVRFVQSICLDMITLILTHKHGNSILQDLKMNDLLEQLLQMSFKERKGDRIYFDSERLKDVASLYVTCTKRWYDAFGAVADSEFHLTWNVKGLLKDSCLGPRLGFAFLNTIISEAKNVIKYKCAAAVLCYYAKVLCKEPSEKIPEIGANLVHRVVGEVFDCNRVQFQT